MSERTLDLVLKGFWYDLIKSGVKREEYREVTPYWCKRILYSHSRGSMPITYWNIALVLVSRKELLIKDHNTPTYVRFRRGYTKESMLFKIDDISIGIGKAELGAPQEEVFIIKFSEI